LRAFIDDPQRFVEQHFGVKIERFQADAVLVALVEHERIVARLVAQALKEQQATHRRMRGMLGYL
jgi:hypothetical protein